MSNKTEVSRCPKCAARVGACPECGKEFEHGTASNCDNESCVKVNAPIDCRCGLVVAQNKLGVITLEGRFIPWRTAL